MTVVFVLTYTFISTWVNYRVNDCWLYQAAVHIICHKEIYLKCTHSCGLCTIVYLFIMNTGHVYFDFNVLII